MNSDWVRRHLMAYLNLVERFALAVLLSKLCVICAGKVLANE